jgi:hypothetical protein
MPSGAAAALDLTTISGLQYWFDASSEVYADDTLIGTSGSTEWHDRSGNARDLLKISDASRPTFKTGIALANGKSVVRFVQASTHHLRAAAVGFSDPLTVIAVAQFSAAATNPLLWCRSDDGGALKDWLYRGSVLNWNGAGVGGDWSADTGTAAFKIVVAQYITSGGKGYINGGSDVHQNAVGTAPFTDRLGISGNTAGTLPFGGDLAEFALWNKTLSATELNLVGNSLATKYGLTWTAVS